MSEPLSPANKAWATRRSPVYRARKTAFASQRLLKDWAETRGWHCVFLDAKSGSPRQGIIDAVLLRPQPKNPDKLELHLVQLKAGSAGITAAEVRRLKAATQLLEPRHLIALVDGQHIEFTPHEPK